MIRVRSLLVAAVSVVAAACAPAGSPGSAPATAPAPAPRPGAPAGEAARPAPAPAPAPTPAPAAEDGPARDWQLRDPVADGVPGTGAERALRELLAGRTPARTVIVAVIDGGVDTAHVDLVDVLWRNPTEVPGNGKDDDGNGYVDDTWGWNFIGGADGRNVHHDTFELTRLHAACLREAEGGPLAAPRAATCDSLGAAFAEKRQEVNGTLAQIRNIDAALSNAQRTLRGALSLPADADVPVERVRALQPADASVAQARGLFLNLAANGLTPKALAQAKEAYEGQARYGLDPSFDPRDIVGDDFANAAERRYGNRDVTGPDASHGTHVAGIIAAARGNGVGIDGIAPAVRIMALRAVPDGDERDKDVANAIRYAADNGAHIINMSFGKGHSPRKGVVDEAVRYAASKGVLLVHAAGNDANDIDVTPNFPSATLGDGTRAATWIEVGASSWQGGAQLAAPFSNYGAQRVDLFAPGTDVLSTMPGNAYERQDGTSMAAPVVSGVAALLMAYYPELSAAEVRTILLESVTDARDADVVPPGSPPNGDARVKFGTLSRTGGVVNAYEAVRRAEARRKAVQP